MTLSFQPLEYEVSADGQRFLVIQDLAQRNRSASFVVAHNWFAKFKDQQKK